MAETEMVELVARAIGETAVSTNPKWDLDFPWLEDVDSNSSVDLNILARAAIEAMREPTEAMEMLGLREMTIDPTWAKPVWQAMIDAALSPASKD